MRLFRNLRSVSTAAASGLAGCVSGLSDRFFDGLFLWTSAENGWHSNFTLVLRGSAVHVYRSHPLDNKFVFADKKGISMRSACVVSGSLFWLRIFKCT